MPNKLINQHKRMAMGEQIDSGAFDVEPLESYSKPHPNPKEARNRLADNQRSVPRTKGYHPEPDHGPTD